MEAPFAIPDLIPPPPRTSLTADPAEIRRALSLLVAPGSVIELRCLTEMAGIVSGYFDDMELLATAAEQWSGRATGVYITLNPVQPAVLGRAANRVRERTREGQTTKDAEILSRVWFPVDLDPVRPQGVSATEEERAAALETAARIAVALRHEGWASPLRADSGNGAHLLYQVDLPNDATSKELLKNCLAALAYRFNDPRVEVDKTTFNASRIWKLYGTLAAKGDSMPGRPHRLARLL